MTLLDALPAELRSEAYVAGKEGAWNRANALRVIDCLAGLGAITCRIEIWLPSDPGPTIPTPIIYAWEFREPAGAPPDELVDRSLREASEYVSSFSWDEEDLEHQGFEPYFNIDAYGGPIDE